MDVFVARQPIFSRDQSVFAYELLFREGPENGLLDCDGDAASAQVVTDSLSVFGLDMLAGGRLAFIKTTRRMLVEELCSVLPPDRVVLELHGVKAERRVLDACRSLTRAGYTLALDHCTGDSGEGSLLDLVRFAKVDLCTTTRAQREHISERCGERVSLIAECVETVDQIAEGLELGYAYFQGFFFCRPQMISRREVPTFKMNYLRFLQRISAPELDFDDLEDVVRREVSLCVRLLRLLNSAAFGLEARVHSVKQALVLLGEKAVRKWATMLALEELADDRPAELVATALIRARLCEELAPLAGHGAASHDLFLVGMLSMLDAIVGRPLEELLGEMAVSDEIHAGVLEDDCPFGRIRALAAALERAEWDEFGAHAAALGIDEQCVPGLYAEAAEWTRRALGSSG